MAKKNIPNQAHALKSLRSLRAVQDFSCIGGDCENNCCHSWKVSLDKRDYSVWRNKAKKQPAELELFQQYVKKEEGKGSFASIKFENEKMICPFQDESGLCRVHAKLGPEALSGTCRSFPKKHNVDKHSMQVSGTLGCPEYARQVLANDAATDVVDVAIPTRDTSIFRMKSAGLSWHWQRCLPEIGELGLSILKSHNPRANLAERLFVVSTMMAQIEDYGSNPSKPLDLPLLSQRIAPLLDIQGRSEVIEQFRSLSIPASNLSLQFVFSLFAYRLTIDWQEMSRYWDGIYASYKSVDAAQMNIVPGEQFNVNVDTIAPVYYARRKVLHQRAGAVLQRWYERAFCNQFFSGSGQKDETPLAYLGRHLVTIMMFDFAICSHEAVDPLLQGAGPLSEEEHDLLKKHAVDIMHRVTRTMLHLDKLTIAMSAVMQEQKLQPWALVTSLLMDLQGDQRLNKIKLNPLAAAMMQ